MLLRSSVFYVVFFSCYIKATIPQYHVPAPTFTVFKPRGLQISIPDDTGINKVIFYVSVNQDLNGREEEYRAYIVQHNGGRWTFDQPAVRLRKGDVVYYKVFVVRYNRGYLVNGEPYIVKERKSRPHTSQTQPECNEYPTEVITSTTTNRPSTITAQPIDDCSIALNNALKLMSSLQSDLKKARDDLDLLKEIALTQPLYLHMSGPAVQEGDPKQLVEFMIFEKLHTHLRVKDAWRNGTAITFELFVLDQKLDVLRRTKKYLKDSKSVIITA